MIYFNQKGDFSKLNTYFERLKEVVGVSRMDEFGRQGVEALRDATPIRTGLTAHSWDYEIVRENNSVSIIFKNSNVNKGVQIAIILQYGHGTRNGGYVQGRDYINPAIKPIFDNLAKDMWRDITKL